MNRRIHSVTTLDKYREYLSGETWNGEEYTTELFIEELTSEFTQSPAAEAGTAVHEMFEKAEYGVLPDYALVNGWSISLADVDFGELVLPKLRELRLNRTHLGFTLYGRVDSMTAKTIRDIKTSSRPDPEKFLSSYQWRTYLWMSGADRFVFDVFEVKLDAEAKSVLITGYQPHEITRYPGMDQDVEDLIEEYVDCLRALGMYEADKGNPQNN